MKPDPFRRAAKKVRQPNDDDDFEYDRREWEGPDYWREPEPTPMEAWQRWDEHNVE